MNADAARFKLPILLILVCATCSACTFKVLDSVTDEPIPGVDVHAEVRGMLPGIGHPMEYTAWWWNTKTDEDGEFMIWSSDASIDLSKDGYVKTETVRTYRINKTSSQRDQRIFYLTKQSDEFMERVKYLVEKANDELEQFKKIEVGSGYPGHLVQPLIGVAVNYGESKSRVRSGRDWAALKEFCQFAPVIKAQREAGWPNMGTLESLHKHAEALIRDCESRR